MYCELYIHGSGESWQNIMLDCVSHKHGEEGVICDGMEDGENGECGSDTAYAYFISFYVLCSFLVSMYNIHS